MSLYGAEPITGLWKNFHEDDGRPGSIILVYENNGKVFARILITIDKRGQFYDTIWNPVKRVKNVKGEPYFSGLDLVWDMEDIGEKWSRGKILNPETARIYSCDMWIDDGKLIVRGKIGLFGRNQVWLPVSPENDLPQGFVMPEIKNPLVPQVK